MSMDSKWELLNLILEYHKFLYRTSSNLILFCCVNILGPFHLTPLKSSLQVIPKNNYLFLRIHIMQILKVFLPSLSHIILSKLLTFILLHNFLLYTVRL